METISTLLALCEGTPSFIGGFPSQRVTNAETASIHVVIVTHRAQMYHKDQGWFLSNMSRGHGLGQSAKTLHGKWNKDGSGIMDGEIRGIFSNANIGSLADFHWIISYGLADQSPAAWLKTHRGQDKMATILQTKFCNPFSSIKNVSISIKISLTFAQKAMIQIMAWHRQAIIWTKDGIVYWRICASLGLDKLTTLHPILVNIIRSYTM